MTAPKLRYKESLKPVVTVIIMTHNRKELLRLAISSILKNTTVPFEFWVVDWKSDDGSRVMLNEEYKPLLTRLEFDDSDLGYAACNDKYMRQCTTPYIYLMNNDCAAFSGWLRNAIDLRETDDKVGHVASLVLRDNFLVMSHGANINTVCNTCIPYMQRTFNDPILMNPGNYAYAGFGLYKTEVYKAVGYLESPSPNHPIYWDDTDYGMKINEAGLDVRYCPNSRIMHRMELDTNRSHHGIRAMNDGRVWFKSRWGAFVAQNGGYAPPYPKGDYPCPVRTKS